MSNQIVIGVDVGTSAQGYRYECRRQLPCLGPKGILAHARNCWAEQDPADWRRAALKPCPNSPQNRPARFPP